MDIRQIRYLLTIADAGSFTQAAHTLHISQPALSQQIRQFEAELGSVLLDRAGRRVRLTAAGMIVVRHARRILAEVDAAQTALQELAGLQRGSLTVGVVQTVNAYLMPAIVAQFTTKYPGVHVEIVEGAADAIEQRVQEGTFQLGIGFVPSTTVELDVEPLFDEELMLVTSLDHPLAARAVVDTSELDHQPLVLLSPSFCTRRLWDACVREAGIAPLVQIEMNTIGSILATVRRTKSATILPALALHMDAADGLASIHLRHPTPCRTVGLLWQHGGYRCVATQAFAQVVRNELVVRQQVASRLEMDLFGRA
jgi:LysR family cyn operon transcriptional activator